MTETELVNVGLSRASHAALQRLKEDRYFDEMVDGYRFAVALALAHGGATTEFTDRQNFINVGSLDRDGSLATVVAALRKPSGESVYRTVEKLATWGVEELARRADVGKLSVAGILEEASAIAEMPSEAA